MQMFPIHPQSNASMPMYDLVHQIEYLDCVINEAQRLYPPVYTMNRECKKACTINGVHFPAGIEVILPFYVLHNDPDAWPDVDKFDPERFRGPNKDKFHPYQVSAIQGPSISFSLVTSSFILPRVDTRRSSFLTYVVSSWYLPHAPE